MTLPRRVKIITDSMIAQGEIFPKPGELHTIRPNGFLEVTIDGKTEIFQRSHCDRGDERYTALDSLFELRKGILAYVQNKGTFEQAHYQQFDSVADYIKDNSYQDVGTTKKEMDEIDNLLSEKQHTRFQNWMYFSDNRPGAIYPHHCEILGRTGSIVTVNSIEGRINIPQSSIDRAMKAHQALTELADIRNQALHFVHNGSFRSNVWHEVYAHITAYGHATLGTTKEEMNKMDHFRFLGMHAAKARP